MPAQKVDATGQSPCPSPSGGGVSRMCCIWFGEQTYAPPSFVAYSQRPRPRAEGWLLCCFRAWAFSGAGIWASTSCHRRAAKEYTRAPHSGQLDVMSPILADALQLRRWASGKTTRRLPAGPCADQSTRPAAELFWGAGHQCRGAWPAQ